MDAIRRHPLRWAAAALVLIVHAVLAWRAAHWEDRVLLEDTFGSNDRMQAFMEEAGGTRVEGGLGAEGGATAIRRYRFARATNQRVSVAIKAARNPEVRVTADVIAVKKRIRIDPSLLDGRPIEITKSLPPAGSRIEIRIENLAAPGSPPALALESFSIERRGIPLAINWGAFVFFWSVSAFFWVLLFAVIVPEIAERVRADRGAMPENKRTYAAAGAALVLAAFLWLAASPLWQQRKDYDDRAAISNGATLLDFGYQPSLTYFRSRVRPAFPAIIQPLLVLWPHRLEGYWFNPSDFNERVWYIHGQDNWTLGTSIYPILSFAALGLALAMAGLAYALFREAGAAPAAACLASILFLVFYKRALAIPITQTVNLFVNVIAAWAFLKWGAEGPAWRRFAAGLPLGLALIEKETGATTALAIGFFLILFGSRAEIGRRLLGSAPFWAAAGILPLWYFGLVSDGGFRELFKNFDDHLTQQELNKFEPLTFAGALRDLWIVFGVGLPLALAGLAAALRVDRLRPRGDAWFFCWMIACLPVFTLPYIFPRFLQFFIPAAAFWIATGGRVAALARSANAPKAV